MLTPRQTIAIVLLAATTVLAQAQEPAKTDPKSGKKCVTFFGSEPPDNAGKHRLIFRNICASPFQVQINAIGRVREARIEPGSTEKPTKVTIECKIQERCDTSKWVY